MKKDVGKKIVGEMKSAAEVIAEFERKHVRPQPGPALIVGSKVYPTRIDRRALHKEAVGWDLEPGEGVDRVVDLEAPLHASGIDACRRFAHIECMSVLEHTKTPWMMADNLQTLLQPGGTIFITAPFAWRIHNYPGDYWRFTCGGLRLLFPRIDWQVLNYASYALFTDGKVPVIKSEGFPFIPRTDAVGFGRLVA